MNEGWIIEHSRESGSFIAMDARGARVSEKVRWTGDRDRALRFARQGDAMAFSDAFCAGSGKPVPFRPTPAVDKARFRVQPEKKPAEKAAEKPAEDQKAGA